MITKLTVRDTYTGPALPIDKARRELAEVNEAAGVSAFLTESLELEHPAEKQTAPPTVQGRAGLQVPVENHAKYSAARSALRPVAAGEH